MCSQIDLQYVTSCSLCPWYLFGVSFDTVNNLDLLYANQGKMAEAENMYRRVLDGKEKIRGSIR